MSLYQPYLILSTILLNIVCKIFTATIYSGFSQFRLLPVYKYVDNSLKAYLVIKRGAFTAFEKIKILDFLGFLIEFWSYKFYQKNNRTNYFVRLLILRLCIKVYNILSIISNTKALRILFSSSLF